MEVQVVIRQTNDGQYAAEAPGIPGCVGSGATIDEAMSQISARLEERLSARVAWIQHLGGTPAVALESAPDEGERYTAPRKAEFLLSSAVDPEDYADAVEEVRKLGVDPETVRHYKPAGA